MRLLFLLLFQFAFLMPALCQEPKLYVLLPSEIRPHAMRNLLESACPDLEIKIFPRYREFWAEVTNNPPDAFLVLRPVSRAVLEKLPDAKFRTKLRGSKNGSTEEEYVFLAEKPLDLSKLDESTTIGAIQLLDRRAMPSFVAEKFGGKKPKLRTVTKLEDLLSLLQFKYADAIFVPKSKVEYYLTKSRLVLKTQELPGVSIGLPELVINDTDPKRAQAIVDALLGLSDDVKSKLGVETWSQQ